MSRRPWSVITLAIAGLICIVEACAERQETGSSYIVELELIAELKDSPGEIEFSLGGSFSSYILRDRRGRFYAHPYGGHRIAVFDSVGVYLYTIGRAGNGPGELGRSPMAALCDSDDRIWVWEFMYRKATIYDADGAFVETVRLPHRPEIQLKDGSLLGIESAGQPSAYSGYPLHRVSVTGELLSSYGNVIPGYSRERAFLYQMVGALTSDGLLWMTPIGRFSLELWDPLSERQLKDLPVEVPWFKETTSNRGNWMEVEPTATINNLSVDENGLIWILIQTADDDWRPVENSAAYDEAPVTPEVYSACFDWVIQAIHPETGKVQAERRMKDHVWMLRGSTGLVTVKIDEETGIIRYSIWRPVLVIPADIINN